jgi:hypothetical protein
MFLGLVLFNAPNGRIADLYYLGGDIVCPIFPVNSSHDVYGPFVNALLYASVAWILLRATKRFRLLRTNL